MWLCDEDDNEYELHCIKCYNGGKIKEKYHIF